MINANHPEINVDELMQKIREEIASRHKFPLNESTKLNGTAIEGAVKVSLTESISPVKSISHMEALLIDAEPFSEVSTKFPDKFNRFPFNTSKPLQKFILKVHGFLFKKQRIVNNALIQVSRDSLELNRQLFDQVNALQAQLNSVGDRMQGTETQLHALGSRMQGTETQLHALGSRMQGTETQLHALGSRLQGTETQLNQFGDRLQGTETQLNQFGDRLQGTETQLNQFGDRLQGTETQLNQFGDRLQGTETQLNQFGDRLQGTETQLNQFSDRLQGTETQLNQFSDRLQGTETQLNQFSDRLQGTGDRLNATNERFHTVEERYIRNDSYLKSDLMQQKRLISIFLEEAHKRLPEPFSQEQLQTFVKEEPHFLDAFYAAFEDEFRGTREQILERLKVYLPLIRDVKVGRFESPIIDIGCGRGEWLELLRESGYVAKGIDINRVTLEQCRARGLDVIESDVIAYLQSLPDASLGAITGFHIIEHLPFEVLVKLLNETERVLEAGGLVVFETPNPENIVVGSCNFYSDPTHKNPIFPPTIKFLVEQHNFVDVRLLRLSQGRIGGQLEFIEMTNPIATQLNSIIDIVKSHFYAAPDFAVIGRKALPNFGAIL